MWKKFRLPPFSFSIVIYSITCCTLLNKIHVGARFTDDAYATDFQRNDTGASKPAARYFNLPSFLPSFKHAACSLFYTRESWSFAKVLPFKSALKMPTESINAALSTNSLLFFTHCHVPGHQYHCIMFNERPVNETKN